MMMVAKTELVFIVDRSGSMSSIRAAMEEGYEKLIADQKKVPGKCHVSVRQFNDAYETVCDRVPLADALRITIKPRGQTALYDAVARTIDEVGDRLAKTKERDRPDKVIVCVITDGHENASTMFKHGDVRGKIDHQQKKYAWEFVFLGGEIGAVETAKGLGITRAAWFEPNAHGTQALFNSLGGAIVTSRTTGGALEYDQHTYNTSLGK